MSEKTFDAARYLTKLKGKDYLEVKWRLLWLRTEHPNATIETELMQLHLNPGLAVFRAKVAIPDAGSATGWGQEEAKDFGDFLEKAETKALGRALAALGYGTQFTEDFDFAEGDPNRVVDAPVDRPTSRSGYSNGVNGTTNGYQSGGTAVATRTRPTMVTLKDQPASDGPPQARPVLPATEPQVKAIYAIGRGAQAMDEAEVDAKCKELYGATPSGLSRRQASEFIDALKSGSNN